MATSFDGSTAYLTRGALAGLADGMEGLVSIWFQFLGGNASNQLILSVGTPGELTPGFAVGRGADNLLFVAARNSAGTLILNLLSTNTLTADGLWHHLAASWDLSASGRRHLYVDGVDRLNASTFTVGQTIDYTKSTVRVGADASSASPASFLNGALYDMVFWNEYLDLSTTTNLANLISTEDDLDFQSRRCVVGYGFEARDPVDARPFIYLNGSSGNIKRNRGLGGNFTPTGTLANVQGPPMYRPRALYPTPGERWFDSEQSGFSYPRSRVFRDPEDGILKGDDEQDSESRYERHRAVKLHTFIFPDEEDSREVPP